MFRRQVTFFEISGNTYKSKWSLISLSRHALNGMFVPNGKSDRYFSAAMCTRNLTKPVKFSWFGPKFSLLKQVACECQCSGSDITVRKLHPHIHTNTPHRTSPVAIPLISAMLGKQECSISIQIVDHYDVKVLGAEVSGSLLASAPDFDSLHKLVKGK